MEGWLSGTVSLPLRCRCHPQERARSSDGCLVLACCRTCCRRRAMDCWPWLREIAAAYALTLQVSSQRPWSASASQQLPSCAAAAAAAAACSVAVAAAFAALKEAGAHEQEAAARLRGLDGLCLTLTYARRSRLQDGTGHAQRLRHLETRHLRQGRGARGRRRERSGRGREQRDKAGEQLRGEGLGADGKRGRGRDSGRGLGGLDRHSDIGARRSNEAACAGQLMATRRWWAGDMISRRTSATSTIEQSHSARSDERLFPGSALATRHAGAQ